MFHPSFLTTFQTVNHSSFLAKPAARKTYTPGIPHMAVNDSRFYNRHHGESSFFNVMNDLAGTINKDLSAPNDLMQRAMTVGDVDVHDIAIANARADMTVSIASQALTKIVQAYEKVQQIQV
ncbi:MAG: flagellar hook-basal body complex protein FliE [Cyanobacteria bacterium HKST-UBA06]|nr:flagellar hook-basal body complex protein FliE [Cyanobacteria bacterium HKST-UBA05]MCA9799617.1 flagellar hook-basal body complex protein FliE [Cyanobacteria bacterium HKST-UBA04]MCA9806791.1 flagellar hook-basal body complex protein FliE [Cyanobacteria bacterium HKST-UBA06]MCA9841426.1 flagellar hook-basal body complex protein FliE [Cyanobacteria bacterium HKST-UBA03]